MGKMIGAAEFKAHCLRIMEEASRTGETVVITKRGKPFMEMRRAESEKRKPLFGSMKGTIQILGDIEGPAYEGPWNAELGILGDED
jgi:antitoxin (DNA-binding transcriptional repressor) of toxin-antitoxin stability system